MQMWLDAYGPQPTDTAARIKMKTRRVRDYISHQFGIELPDAPAAPDKLQGRGPQQEGAPARIRDDADFDALPPGTRFIDPEGRERVKPGGAAHPPGMMRLGGPRAVLPDPIRGEPQAEQEAQPQQSQREWEAPDVPPFQLEPPPINEGENNTEADDVMEGRFGRMLEESGYQGTDLEEAMRLIWDRNPTDMTGEVLDYVARTMGKRPPWHPDFDQGGR
jgi:hypothetical protein